MRTMSIFDPWPARAVRPETVCDWRPAVDVHEEPERYVLLADVPGVARDEIEISVEDGVLTIRGETGDDGDGRSYSRRERRRGRFCRMFVLPDEADAEGISAREHRGVLELSIPKRAEARPRRIEVDAA